MILLLPCGLLCRCVGGGQEQGRRAGTENVLLISALGTCQRLPYPCSRPELETSWCITDHTEACLQQGVGGVARERGYFCHFTFAVSMVCVPCPYHCCLFVMRRGCLQSGKG